MATMRNDQLAGLDRCPHCAIADPFLRPIWHSQGPLARADGGIPSRWSVYTCVSCGSLVTAAAFPGDPLDPPEAHEIFPEPREAHEDLPPIVRRFLQQAYDTLHAPDAAAVMAGSAVDAMLKALGYKKGSVYARVREALADNKLTQGMADWANEVRLGSNRPRHADSRIDSADRRSGA